MSFAHELKEYLDRLKYLRQRGASEDSIRDAFLGFLRSVFPRLEQTEPILLEKHIPALRVRGGFADALYSDIIFEFKVRLDDRSRPEGIEELSRYLGNQKHPERYVGILTDGEAIEVYSLRNGTPERIDQQRLTADRPEAADLLKVWLDCYLFHERHVEPTADDVARRFGDKSPTFWHSRRVLADLWAKVGSHPSAQTKFGEWQSLLSIVYGSPIGNEDLFLRHTYLAHFARVLAFVALERRAPNTAELTGIPTGATFDRMGFENFVGDDFFTWINESAVGREARDFLQSLAARLSVTYDLTAIREDLLKELYQELVDPETRHDLGEFYTPDWLAELTLRKASFPPDPIDRDEAASLLDPSCGSGTFLFTAVRLLRERGLRGKALVEFCSQHLAGVDVHPLAVTIAKTNLLLALGDDLRGYGERFLVPVYMADSLAAVKHDQRRFRPVVPVSVGVDAIAKASGKERPSNIPENFGLPIELADHPDLLDSALNALLEFSDASVDDSAATQGFYSRLTELGVPSNDDWELNLRLMRWLLKHPVTDSVWSFILQNAFRPVLLARRKFAFVVGNPPWLSYRYIKHADYQKRVRKLVFDFRLLDKLQMHLFTQMELATLFFAFCADRYLAENGTLAFVMPRSVLTGAKQHAAFRDQFVAACQYIIDCEQVEPLFNVPTCVLIWSKPTDGSTTKASVPVTRMVGNLPRRNVSLDEANRNWKEPPIETTYTHSPSGTESLSPYRPEIINGATIFPRCLWFVRPPESARVIARQRPQIETDTTTERQAKVPWKGLRLSGSVEAEFLFATLLSDHMLPFGVRQFSLVVLPMTTTDGDELELLHIDAAIRLGKPGLADWLRKAEAIWATPQKKPNQRVDSIYARLDFSKCLTRQQAVGVFKVLYNKQGTHLCSCVVDGTNVTAWQVHGLPVHGFVAENVTYRFETKDHDEAHYLCAVLNAPLVDAAIKPYQTKGSFGAQHGGGERDIHRRPFEVLAIPRFDHSDDRHTVLARLSRTCHDKVSQIVANAADEFFSARIGGLRQNIRLKIRAELEQIDKLVAEVIKKPL